MGWGIPFLHYKVKTWRKHRGLWTQKWVLTRLQICWCLDLGLSEHRGVENNFLLFISPLVHFTFSQQSELLRPCWCIAISWVLIPPHGSSLCRAGWTNNTLCVFFKTKKRLVLLEESDGSNPPPHRIEVNVKVILDSKTLFWGAEELMGIKRYILGNVSDPSFYAI